MASVVELRPRVLVAELGPGRGQMDIYIGSILLEKHRWREGKLPSYRVSEWLDRFKAAGFDGVELWENHAVLCPPEETDALAASPLPIAIFNSYASLEDADEANRKRAAELTAGLNASGVKYNFGDDEATRGQQIRNLRAWADRMPAGVKMLCECHGGSLMETPAGARAVFDELGDDRFEAIVHPFARELEPLREWFGHLGGRITHAHVQTRKDKGICRVRENASAVEEAVGLMREAGFSGSFTLEFTEGTGAPDENIESLFAAAVDDLDFLRDLLQ